VEAINFERMKHIFFTVLMVMASLVPLFSQIDVDLFEYWKFHSDVENSMYKTSAELAFQQLEQRESTIAGLNTREEFLNRQSEVQEKLTRIMGPLPQKTPLNATITGVIKKNDYRVEKILFESMPQYYVTAALFLPVPRKEKLPVVIYAAGHSANGFRSEVYQHVIINLVKKGFAVFAFDPVGQGERWQYLNQDDSRRFNSSTIEHSYPGAQCYVSGYSPTRYFVWDAMRSIDYLLTRKEIDPERIGMTGRSGGGTQTAYAAAVDQRILAAAPECFITKMEYVLKSIGPQDAEQNLYNQISELLDHADLLEVRAPKPALMITTTGDYFSIQGARETFQEVQRFYGALDAVDQVHMVEDDAGHASTLKNREAMYAFFQESLMNPGNPEDIEVDIFPEQELWVTETGNVAELKGATLYTLNRDFTLQQLDERASGQTANQEQLKTTVAKLSGFKFPKGFESAVFSGRVNHDEYAIEKYLLKGGGEYQLPMALFRPLQDRKSEAVLVLDDQGMKQVATGELVSALLGQGYTVLVADLPGIGSMGPGYLKGDAYLDNTSFNQWFAGILTGQSTVAMRAQDIIRMVRFLKSEVDGIETVSAISKGALGSELLHAGLFEPGIKRIGLINMFVSYADIALTPDYKPSFITSVVAGAIKAYDLPDLMASVAPGSLLVVNPLNAMGAVCNDEEISSLLNSRDQVFGDSNSPVNFQMARDLNENQTLDTVLEWLK
jgi:dienelactone hydrolase